MSKTVTFLSVFLCSSLASAFAATPVSYVCNGKYAVGFAFNKKTHAWAPTQFNPRQYLIQVPKRGPNQPGGAQTAVLAVYEVGHHNTMPFFCDQDFNKAGYIRCDGFGETFMFNRKTHRFEHWFTFGYIDPPGSFWGPEGTATPFIEIGTCASA